jgi:hypothetical protein
MAMIVTCQLEPLQDKARSRRSELEAVVTEYRVPSMFRLFNSTIEPLVAACTALVSDCKEAVCTAFGGDCNSAFLLDFEQPTSSSARTTGMLSDMMIELRVCAFIIAVRE